MMHRCQKCKSKMVYCKRVHPVMRLFCWDCRNAKIEGACGLCRSCLDPANIAYRASDDDARAAMATDCPNSGKDCFDTWFSRHYKLYLVNGKPIGIVPVARSPARADLTGPSRRAKVAAPDHGT